VTALGLEDPAARRAALSPLEDIEAMYAEDRGLPIRQSHKNPAIRTVYDEFLGQPNGEKLHHLLHRKYAARTPRGF
jgi:hypothetical protein